MGPTILLVEDDETIVDIIKLVLSEEGFEVIAFSTCVGLQEKLTTLTPGVQPLNPDLIILDINLPTISGSDFCKHLKDSLNFKNIPVILISANINILNIQTECGADDSISKPFNIKTLISKVKQHAALI